MIKRRLLARYTVQNPSDSPLFLLVFKCVIPIYLVLLTFLYSFKNNDLVFIETLLFCVCSYLLVYMSTVLHARHSSMLGMY